MLPYTDRQTDTSPHTHTHIHTQSSQQYAESQGQCRDILRLQIPEKGLGKVKEHFYNSPDIQADPEEGGTVCLAARRGSAFKAEDEVQRLSVSKGRDLHWEE